MKITIPHEVTTVSEDVYELPAFFKTEQFYTPSYIAILAENSIIKICNWPKSSMIIMEQSIGESTKNAITKAAQITESEFLDEFNKTVNLIEALKIA
ncbi:MAG: hypothetical protein ACREHG_00295 [Candidatus Saccharimonadales bacterium]